MKWLGKLSHGGPQEGLVGASPEFEASSGALHSRMHGAIVGSLVADALSLSTHQCFDVSLYVVTTLVHWYTGTLVHWYTHTLVHTHTGTCITQFYIVL